MFCGNCGAKLPDGAAFCGQCGKVAGLGEAARFVSPDAARGTTSVPGVGSSSASYGVSGSGGMTAPSSTVAPLKSGRKRGMAAVIAAVAVVAVVVAGAFVAFGHGASGSSSSAQEVVKKVDAAYSTLFEGEVNSETFASFFETLFGCFPPEVIEVMLEEIGGDDLTALAEYASDYYASSFSYFASMDVDVTMRLGDSLDEDEIESVNDMLETIDVYTTIQAGYWIDGELTIRTLEDIGIVSEGYTQTMDLSSLMSQFVVIKIDGLWYLLWGIF